jgi:S1-C subfamily serine protease
MSSATAPRSRRSVSPALAIAAVALVGVIALAVVLAAVGAFGAHDRTTVVQQAATASVAGPGLDAAAIYARANPGIVDITGHTTGTTTAGPFGPAEKTQGTQTGTGIVLDQSGDILTAGHVVAGAHSITVTFVGGATRPAQVLGNDTATDIGVLRINPSGVTLHPLPLGSVSGHRVGDPVAVIGDPFDVQRSLSTGVISGLNRSIQAPNGYTIPHAVQTDAAINPGNSGGPVLDAAGRVIGITDQIDTGNSGADSSTGVGFAVSIDVVKGELSQLEAGHPPGHGFLGVGASDATDSHGDAGALVGSVQPGGPAARAGMRAGDLIVQIGGRKIAGVSDLIATTAKYAPGDRITVIVIRNGKRVSLGVTLAKQPTRAVNG